MWRGGRQRIDGANVVGELCLLLLGVLGAAAAFVFALLPVPTSPGKADRWSIGGLVFGVAASATYLLERLYERLRAGRSDPTLVLSEVHATFYWRALLAAWAGVVVALIHDRLSGSHSRATRIAWFALALGPAAVLWSWKLP